MQKINKHTGIVAPLDIANVDTDAIIPKQFLQKITRLGFGQHLFHDWRYLDNKGEQENPDFILNQPHYKGASILLSRENFGCGSSREHAPWALADYGFNIIIAPSFADIFYTNAINNQIVPICLKPEEIDALFAYVETEKGACFTLNLKEKILIANQKNYGFSLNPFHHNSLLEGLDSIDLTLKHQDKISAFEAKIPAFFN